MWNGMLSAWYNDFFASLPFHLLVCYAWSLPLQWSSTLLMWADVRTPGSGDSNRNAAAWWIGQLVRTRPSIFNCVLFSTFLVGPWGPFLVIRVYLTYCILSTLNLVPSEYSCMWCFINWGYSVSGMLQKLLYFIRP